MKRTGSYYAPCLEGDEGQKEIARLHLRDDEELGQLIYFAVYTAPDGIVQQRHLERYEGTTISPVSPEELLKAIQRDYPTSVFLDGRKLAGSAMTGLLKDELGIPIKHPRLIRLKPPDALREEFALTEEQNPRIVGPPNPERKAAELERAVGKSVAAVEYGVVEGLPGWVHEGEAMVLHFTDGSALSIEIGSNAKNLSHEHEGLNPEDVHAALIPIWRERDSPSNP